MNNNGTFATDNSDNNTYTIERRNLSSMFFENLKWLNTNEAAFFLRKSPHALRQMTYKGKVKAHKFGGRLFYDRHELSRLVNHSFY